MENKKSNFSCLIHEICNEENIELYGLADNWVYQLKKNGLERHIFGYQFGLNSAVCASLCLDKGACSELLSAHNVPNIEHICLMSPAKMKYVSQNGAWKPAIQLLDKYGTLVVKENEGTAGDGVYLVHNQLELEETTCKIFGAGRSVAISPYTEMLEEYRIIILDGEVQVIFSKNRPHLVGDGKHTLLELYAAQILENAQFSSYGIPTIQQKRVLEEGEKWNFIWKHNLGQGAGAILHREEELQEEVALAKRAFACVGARFASCDVVKTKGGCKILEINSGVMMENLAGTSSEARRLAKSIYRKAILKMFEG